MNSSSSSSANVPDNILSNTVNNGSLGYGIGISIVLLLITVITSAAYFCTRTTIHNSVMPARSPPPPQHSFSMVNFDTGEGLDEATLISYPKFLYSEAKAKYPNKDSTSACCSICLADYRSNDVLRLLPECDHMFHLRCIDPWLRLHPTCPVCRTSPMPTPLADVVPPPTERLPV